MKRLLFVYNADSGVASGLLDFAHKIISPDTYECNLCKVTYGLTGMKRDWKSFVNGLSHDHEVEFLHRDEFLKSYPEIKERLPALFEKEGKRLKVLVSSDEMKKPKDVDELKQLVSKRINEARGG